MTRYLDRRGLSFSSTDTYLQALDLQYDAEIPEGASYQNTEPPQKSVYLMPSSQEGWTPLPGDVVITGPFHAKEWSWLPKQVMIEVVPDGGEVERISPLRYAMKKEGLSDNVIREYTKKQPSPRAKYLQEYEKAVRWSESHSVDLRLGTAFAPYELVTSPARAIGIINLLRDRPYALDYETRKDMSIHGVALADDQMSWYLWGDALRALPEVLELMKQNPAITHGGKFEYQRTSQYSMRSVQPTDLAPYHDTQILNWCITSIPGMNRLKPLVKQKLHRDVLTYDDVVGEVPIDEIDPDQVARYSAAGDARNTYDLFPILEAEARAAGVWHVYNDIERPLVPVLAEMELNGVLIDLDVVRQLTVFYAGRRGILRRTLDYLGWHGPEPEAVADWLYKKLGLPILAMTDSGSRGSIDKDTLELLEDLTGSQELHVYRQWRKTQSLLEKFLIPTLNRDSTYLYPRVQQTSTRTGRLSYKDPNFQQFPAREFPDIRKMFVSQPDEVFWSADYSSQEPRIVAVASGDPHMLSDFQEGRDPYLQLGKGMEVRLNRQDLKVMFLAQLYGEQNEYTSRFAAARPEFIRWRDGVLRSVRETGYAYSLEGRRRHLPSIWSRDPRVMAAAEREAMNMPVQGTAADITKLAMPPAFALLKQAMHYPQFGAVHDELVGRMKKVDAVELGHELERIMVEAYPRVPLTADLKTGPTWYDAKG